MSRCRSGPALAPGSYPGLAGGPWLRKILVPSGLRAVVVPSGAKVTVQPHWWITTWWWNQLPCEDLDGSAGFAGSLK